MKSDERVKNREEIIAEINKIEQREDELRGELYRLRTLKCALCAELMMTPEAKEAYKEAWRKVRYGSSQGEVRW
ncbi:MAG: hypothetical protein JRD89_13600 [Deltaproteobacteria bacterium]|nr:hypothetical protein [Deltaproteobacteria bacterium]